MTCAGADRFRWSAGARQPGKYEVRLDEAGFRTGFELPSTGTIDAWIVVPPPCEIRVRCVDEETGAAVEPEQVTWHTALPDGVRSWSSNPAVWDADARCWSIRAPVGRVRISAQSEEYVATHLEIAAELGRHELVLRLTRVSGLTLVLRDGETEVPLSLGTKVDLEPLDGQQAHGTMRWASGSLTLLRRPGRYELRIAPLDGYAPIPAAVVSLEEGTVTRHVVALDRLF